MESVKICHFKLGGKFCIKNLLLLFLHYRHVKKTFVCEDISAEYEFKHEKFKGGIDRAKVETQQNSKHYRRAHVHIDIYIIYCFKQLGNLPPLCKNIAGH